MGIVAGKRLYMLVDVGAETRACCIDIAVLENHSPNLGNEDGAAISWLRLESSARNGS